MWRRSIIGQGSPRPVLKNRYWQAITSLFINTPIAWPRSSGHFTGRRRNRPCPNNNTKGHMKRINIGFLFPLIALVILVCALSQQLFILPPLGKLLDPFIGAVQNENDRPLQAKELTIPVKELEAPVQVFFDERKVPHIYAQNTTDLYFAQGYITAFFRLWQMDFG